MEYAHPKDTKKISYKLPLGAIIFVVIILLGFITTKEPELKFAMDTPEMLELALQRSEIIKPADAFKILNENNTTYRFIDLRNPHQFINGHVQGALNIPMTHLLAKENLEQLDEANVTNILYAETHDMACGPWMMLRQLGYENNIILLGGYSILSSYINHDSLATKLVYEDEKAKYDYAKIVKETAGSGVSAARKTTAKKIIKKKKKKGPQGGC